MNPSNPANGTEMILHDTGGGYRLRIGSTTTATVGIGVQYNASYFLNVGGLSNFNQARVATDLEVIGNLNLTGNVNCNGTTANINDLTDGLTFYKATTNASNVVTVANDSGKLRFRSTAIDAYNPNDTSQQLFLNTHANNAVRCNKSGIGANAGVDIFNCPGGNAFFNATCSYQQACTFNNDILVYSNSKIYRRADANNSLNLITNAEIKFSLQANRATDPTTGTIALQLNDTNGITLNRAVVNNLTFNSIGNIVGEADVISWGKFKIQNSGEIREVLDTQYKMYVRNGDSLGELNLIVGLESSTPEIQLTDGKVNLLGKLEITHTDVAGS